MDHLDYTRVSQFGDIEIAMNLKNKKVLIVGFGQSGQAALKFILEQEAAPAVVDLHDEDHTAVFESVDLIVVSPGVPIRLRPLQWARAKGIPIVSEMELALPILGPQIIAVTGTNGKTTTATLIHHLLATAGKKSVLAGNVGRPLTDCIADLERSEFLVLEVSSYQMEITPSLKAHAACLLNITEDHLHWHESFEAYVNAKAKLIRQSAPEGRIIYNLEDPIVTQVVEAIPAERWGFSTRRIPKRGGWVEEGKLCLRLAFEGPVVRFDLAPCPLKGITGWENMLAALLAVFPHIKDAAVAQKGLQTFVPLAHRLQEVCKAKGVTYINDSKATNVGAVVKALAATPAPILWIAGGQDKGGSYEPLKDWVKKKSARPVFLGRANKNWPKFFGLSRRWSSWPI